MLVVQVSRLLPRRTPARVFSSWPSGISTDVETFSPFGRKLLHLFSNRLHGSKACQPSGNRFVFPQNAEQQFFSGNLREPSALAS